MIEVMRTNDPVRLSYAVALLKDAGCYPQVADRFTAAIHGGVSAIERRVLVPDEHAATAKQTLKLLDEPPPDGGPDISGDGTP